MRRLLLPSYLCLCSGTGMMKRPFSPLTRYRREMPLESSGDRQSLGGGYAPSREGGRTVDCSGEMFIPVPATNRPSSSDRRLSVAHRR